MSGEGTYERYIFTDRLGHNTIVPVMLGQSGAMAVVRDAMRKAIDGQASVRISGAPGTGKKTCRAVIAALSPLGAMHPVVLGRKGKCSAKETLTIAMPSLQTRGPDDILDLIDYFGHAAARRRGVSFHGFSISALDVLAAYDWPGNVAELLSVVDAALAASRGPVVLSQRHLPLRILQGGVPPLAETERRALGHALGVCDGNVRRAAALLRISPATIYRKISAWDEGGASFPKT